MRVFRRLLGASALFTLFMAAAQPIQAVRLRPVPEERSESRRVLEKNYSLGVRLEAFVGNPIVRVKDYYEVDVLSKALRADRPFHVAGKLGVDYRYGVEQLFDIVGIVSPRKLGECYAIAIPQRRDLNFLVKTDGSFTGKILGLSKLTTPTVIVWKYTATPPDVQFERAVRKEVERTRGFTNFEIVYTGRTAEQLTFTYREYTPDDLVRPAFSQSLVYPADADTVRFREIRFLVHPSDSDGLEYTIVEDGAGEPKAPRLLSDN